MGRLLDAYDKLQAQPFGTFTANKSSPGLRQMNSQRSAMTSALRRGIRQAKREGNFERVAKGVEIGNAYGLETTGIGSADARMAGGDAFADKVAKESAINADLANRAAAGVEKIGNLPQEQADTVNPNAKAGAGNGTPIKDDSPGSKFASTATAEPAPRLSFADQEKAKQREVSLAGGFGTTAKARAEKAVAAESLLAKRVDPVTGDINPLDDTEDVAAAEKMGGTVASFRAAIKRQSEMIKSKSRLG